MWNTINYEISFIWRGTPLIFIQVCLQVLGITTVYVKKCSKKPFVSPEGAVSSDKLPLVMSLESASVGAEDYKLEKEKNLGVWR